MGGECSKQKSKRTSGDLFEWKKENEIKNQKNKYANPDDKRKNGPHLRVPGGAPAPQPGPSSAPPAPLPLRSYDDEALERMRKQLNYDSEAFLLNNILLSVQFFENYEREIDQIRNNPVTEREHLINEAMVKLHKHVFFADRLQECVYEHISYQRQRGQSEPLVTPRMFVVYDNVEPSQPGDMSDYSAVLDAPFYKLLMKNCKGELGYVKLKKLAVLESELSKNNDVTKSEILSVVANINKELEIESNDSDDSPYTTKGCKPLQNTETKILDSRTLGQSLKTNKVEVNNNIVESPGRGVRSHNKQISLQAEKGNISNLNTIQKWNSPPLEENDTKDQYKYIKGKTNEPRYIENKPKKQPNNMKNKTQHDDTQRAASSYEVADDTGPYRDSGYRSTNSSRQYDASETDSDYGYVTIIESTTPKKVEFSVQNCSGNPGVLPEKCWTSKIIKTVNNWSENEKSSGSASKSSMSHNLYVTHYYLNSLYFMKNFVDIFIMNLGFGLGFTQDAINVAQTQGASIYCNSTKNRIRLSYEVFPALKLTAWPSLANAWLIRERKIILNPRTNLRYQWPKKPNVDETSDLGCLLVPIGVRPKRGLNLDPNQMLQWRIMFPEAEQYLESTLSHSHIRCYLFALALHKTFLENQTSKLGIDASHIKNHLFWECEDNHANWPEDRLGERLREFLQTLSVHFQHTDFPNYFVQDSNDFNNIPSPLLREAQKNLKYILERPIMYILDAVHKVKYTKEDFYPVFESYRLYEILTRKNPLRLINPAIPETYDEGESDSDDSAHTNPWDKEKTSDRGYLRKKEKLRQNQKRRNASSQKTQNAAEKQARQINTQTTIPQKMETYRRPLVLKFFIEHFIAMARSSDKYEAINQAVIYLQQANRLSILLGEESPGDISAKDFLDVIRDLLPDYQQKLAKQEREKSNQLERSAPRPIHSHQPRFENIVSQGSPTEFQGTSDFTFAEVHSENPADQNNVRLHDVSEEEFKL